MYSNFGWSTFFVFFKNTHTYTDALHQLSELLSTSLNRKDMFIQCAESLQKIFGVTTVKFFTNTSVITHYTNIYRRTEGTQLSYPIMCGTNCICLLYLGTKHSGRKYTKRDQHLVALFALHAALALEKIQAHEEVDYYRTHIETLVQKRTEEIKHTQEEQRQTMIDISHNLQTPLAVIRGEIELLNETPESTDKIECAKKSLDRVSEFIRQLLHLAKLEHSLYTIAHTPLHISNLVEDQADYFETMTKEQGIVFHKNIMPACCIMGNQKLIEEALLNLVTNAIHYRTPTRTSMVQIAVTQNAKHVTITVKDNGIGIDPKHLSKLGSRFYCASKENESHGTGLGLAIVKNIVEKHNGKLSIQSKLGVGSSFSMQFPRSYLKH